jgi:hypothetical protein
MTTRELWREIMFYGSFDRMPPVFWTGWPETFERWAGEGLAQDVSPREYFGGVPNWESVGCSLRLFPEFEEETLEETEEYRIFRSHDGVVQQDWKTKSCIPHFVDFTLKDASCWDDYKKRLQPDPARIPDNLDEAIARAEESGNAIAVRVASMMGWIRNWMGVENMCYLMYDNPEVYADMVDTLAELSCWCIDQTIPRMKSPPDLGFGWEDICGKTGPLVSPDLFEKYVAPGYRKIRNKLEEYGVTILGIDSDGDVEPLAQHWLDSGVNLLFPIEPGTWGATPEHFRKRFGRELLIVGGFDKLVLEKDRAAIDAEFDKHLDLCRAGGFIMEPDHLITPGVPLENMEYYMKRIRELRF